jgi:hypothetical protein
LNVPANIEGFNDTGSLAALEYKDALPAQSTLETLMDIFYLRKAAEIEQGYTFGALYKDQLIIIVTEMDALGYFNDNKISLCHLDLAPCNVLIEPEESPIISGILDWDSDIFTQRSCHVRLQSGSGTGASKTTKTSQRPTIPFPLPKHAN